MQESAAEVARRWACFRTRCKADRPILQIGIARRRRAYARRLRRPSERSNAKKRRRHGVFHLCPGNGRPRAGVPVCVADRNARSMQLRLSGCS